MADLLIVDNDLFLIPHAVKEEQNRYHCQYPINQNDGNYDR